MVGTAEMYAQKLAQRIRLVEIAINIMILLLLGIIIKQYINALGIMRRNKELNAQVFIDKQTKLPNKNCCEQLIEDSNPITQSTGIFMFDLNNLKFINDSLGHEEGDKLILNFSRLIRDNIDASHFVGRYGGDEFIAIIPADDIEELAQVAANVRQATAKYNEANAFLPISYAVGYVLSTEFEQPLMKNLLAEADRRMYINKQETKKLTAALEEDHSLHLHQMMNALEHGYSACYYCDYQNNSYRIMKTTGRLGLPVEGQYSDFIAALKTYILGMEAAVAEDLLKQFSLEYINKHIDNEIGYYDIKFLDPADNYWLVHVMLVDIDKLGRLSHFIITFTDISHTRDIEYAATHDALTSLLNRHAGYTYMEQLLRNATADTFALMMIDVDDFKKINDQYGHSMGDYVLKELAKSMHSFFPQNAIITRYGGDEFLVLTKVSSDAVEFNAFMKRLVASLTKNFVSKDMKPTISVGAVRVSLGEDLQSLFEKADKALYIAKHKGKNAYQIYDAAKPVKK